MVGTYSTREFKLLLDRNGFEKIRCSGGHTIYKKDDKTITIGRKMNKMICRRLIKENELEE